MKIALACVLPAHSLLVCETLLAQQPRGMEEWPAYPPLEESGAVSAAFLLPLSPWRRSWAYRRAHLRRARFLSPWSLYDRHVADRRLWGDAYHAYRWWRALRRVRYDVVGYIPVREILASPLPEHLERADADLLATLTYYRAPFNQLQGPLDEQVRTLRFILGLGDPPEAVEETLTTRGLDTADPLIIS